MTEVGGQKGCPASSTAVIRKRVCVSEVCLLWSGLLPFCHLSSDFCHPTVILAAGYGGC